MSLSRNVLLTLVMTNSATVGEGAQGEDEIPEAVPIYPKSETREKKSIKLGPVPVTVITGFLGAGKTTLVNYVLTAQHGFRIAVILSEFGAELDIERALVSESNDESSRDLVEEFVELGNGCICCSTKHNFVQTLEALMEKRDRFDHILVETTGLANPGPIVSVLWLDDELEAGVTLDAIVTVVDARNLREQIKRNNSENEAVIQIAFADTIILNKVDLLSVDSSPQLDESPQETVRFSNHSLTEAMPDSVNDAAISDLIARIRSINSMAEIVPSVRCRVDLGLVLNRHSYSSQRAAELELMVQSDARKGHVHMPAVTTVGFWVPGFVSLEKVDEWLGNLLWEKAAAMDVFRMKGALNVENSKRMFVLQAVHELYEVVKGREWRETEEQCNKIVVIGKNLDASWLEDSFRRCLVDGID